MKHMLLIVVLLAAAYCGLVAAGKSGRREVRQFLGRHWLVLMAASVVLFAAIVLAYNSGALKVL